jgi:hypothetical protein
MSVTVAQFRSAFPEFTSATQFPDVIVQNWLTFAYSVLPACRWGAQQDMGAMLYCAHMTTRQAIALAEGANGAPPGMSPGVIASKTVGELSISYDVAQADPQSSFWNTTIYGQQFSHISRMIGAGALTLNIGQAPIGIPGHGRAWWGPPFDQGISD